MSKKIKDEYHVKYNKNMTSVAKSIFGNIVKKAYNVIEMASYRNENDYVEYFNQKKKESFQKDLIDFDGEKVLIEFENGKKVMFSSSEWAYMNKVTDEEIGKEY